MKFDKVLVDADILLYQVGYATQHNVYHVWFGGHQGDPQIFIDKRELNKLLKDEDYVLETYQHVQPLLSAKITVDRILEAYKEKFETRDMQLYLTGKGNFREKIATILPYKGNRADSDKPYHYADIKEYLTKKHKAQVIEGQEADDALGIEQYRCLNDNKLSVIVTIDKDLKMIQGYNYNPTKDELINITYHEGQQWFYKQLLMGDSVDNIPGIKGIGKVKAGKLIDGLGSNQQMYDTVYNVYKKHYEDPLKAITEVGRLLWMRTQEGEMWEPLCD